MTDYEWSVVVDGIRYAGQYEHIAAWGKSIETAETEAQKDAAIAEAARLVRENGRNMTAEMREQSELMAQLIERSRVDRSEQVAFKLLEYTMYFAGLRPVPAPIAPMAQA